jgi:hypothetical protein
MRDEDATGPHVEDRDRAARFLLGCLISRSPALLAVDELVREFAGSTRNLDAARVLIDDGLAELLGSGLAHRVDRFVFASQAAIRASQLAL